MTFEFAPLEGPTDRIYRQLHRQYFPGLDRYYTPFLSPTVHRSLTHREELELPTAASLGAETVPQLLTRNPADFLWMAGQCAERGYREVNLNLGCPSGTVVSKGKGAGMLADRDGLCRFLDEVFSAAPVAISVKTRIGLRDPAEFPELLDIFNRYPLARLILHPRVRQAFYSGSVDMDAFAYALGHSRAPVSYNGNLCSTEDIATLSRRFPGVDTVMLGRGLIGDPGMLCPGGTEKARLQAFYEDLLTRYLDAFGGSRNAMFRLKEHWHYLIRHFGNADKLGKRLRKTTDLAEYRAITAEIFETLPFLPRLHPDW